MNPHSRIRARFTSRREDDGATAVEYGLIISLIALFIVGAVGAIGIALDIFFNGVAAAF